MKVSHPPLKFQSTFEAMEEAGFDDNDTGKYSVLVWTDSIKDVDYFSSLQSWQVVNRIPSSNVMCRKASFARIIQKIQPEFPKLYSFVPRTFILPFQNSHFVRTLLKSNSRWIVKPDSGSLGQGITILEPHSEFCPEETLAVAQEYVESFSLENTKFDLRVYVLVTSVDPLEIYVYRDGLARFCSEKRGEHSIFSQITNVTLNKDNPDVEDFQDISQLISDIFPVICRICKVDQEELWKSIDQVIVLSIIASHSYLLNGINKSCPNHGYPRCFQVFGFDVLLDMDLKPHILEVNYRPSLKYHRGPERRMKVNMLRDAMRIAAPLKDVQAAINERRMEWASDSWLSFLSGARWLPSAIAKEKSRAVRGSLFHRAFPAEGELQESYERVLARVHELGTDLLPGSQIPSQEVF